MNRAAPEVGFTVDGRRCTGRAGESLLEALRREGFRVPSLCHHPRLPPAGACRLCLVEVRRGQRARLTTSCDYPLLEGLEVALDTPRVVRHRRTVLALLLSMAPGAEAIRTLAAEYGVTASPFPPAAESDGCILCGLCVRVCREGARAEALGMAGRGARKRLGSEPFEEFPPECIGCGACAWICPTGAVSMEEHAVARWRARWGSARPCRYGLMGLAPGAVCESDYRCATCEVDQRMIDRAAPLHPVFLRPLAGEEEP